MKGLIFSIKRYCIHDGPGIRVTFFMKGCPLNCIWCHNPEGISPVPEKISVTRRIGINEFCNKEVAGTYYSVDDIMQIINKERIFINQSKGGVTFSGGEPMMQTQFLVEVLKACKSEGYHTAVDTSGYSSSENLKLVIPCTDLFLFDLKHTDDKQHRAFTGVTNTIILENLKMIVAEGKEIVIRIPVIPGFNDDDNTMTEFRDLIMALKNDKIIKINLLPFHQTGSAKYKKLNLPNQMEGVEPPASEKMAELRKFFLETGISVKTGG